MQGRSRARIARSGSFPLERQDSAYQTYQLYVTVVLPPGPDVVTVKVCKPRLRSMYVSGELQGSAGDASSEQRSSPTSLDPVHAKEAVSSADHSEGT